MAGYATDRQTLDHQMGGLVTTLIDTLAAIVALNKKLQNDPRFVNALLIADVTTPGGYGYTQTEVDGFKAGFLAMTDLNETAWGRRAQSPANNFLFDAQRLTGVQGMQ